MMPIYDVIVVGLGAMGSAAAYACAQRGWRTLGLEQFDLGHALGSSHGYSRIIREVYYEHPAYVPMAQEAFRRWESLEQATGQQLLTRCRCANIGTPSSEIIQGVSRAVKEHGLPAERWSADDIRRNCPTMNLSDDMCAIVEERAGWLAVEQCVLSMQSEARKHGAVLQGNELLLSWSATEKDVTVTTSKGKYNAAKLILTAGPWATMQLPHLPLTVMRQMQLWFTPPAGSEAHYRSDRFPIFIMDTPLGDFYAIPLEAGPGVKLAQHYGAPEWKNLASIHRAYQLDEDQPVRQFMQRYIPGLATVPLAATSACIYTLTPDRHFVIDNHPDHQNVAIACGFSGHGFKFAPVIGVMLADLVNDPRDVSPWSTASKELFSIKRWQSRSL
jgi:sarcosine oxidase